MDIYFISSNHHKVSEAESILNSDSVTVKPISLKIEEIQTKDMNLLVRDKCIKAFQKIGRPLFVEHTGLELQDLNGFPAGLTQIFWDTLKADKFSEMFGIGETTSVIARTLVAYCDSKKIYTFEGMVEGKIVRPPRGDRAFQWDCVFQPSGFSETFAEMGINKNEISMRRRALDKFAQHLKGSSNV